MFSKDRLLSIAPRAVPTIIIGAIPATLICVIPAMFLGGMFKAIVESFFAEAPGADGASVLGIGLLFLWSAAAVYGTICLWLVAFTGPTRGVVVGLILGMLAISPMLYGAILEVASSIGSAFPTVLWVFGPFVTALGWLVVAAIDWFREGGQGADAEAE